MKIFPRHLLFLCLTLIAAPAFAEPYIASVGVFTTLIAPPPTENSEQRQKEVALIVEQQKNVDTNEIARAIHEVDIRSELMAQDVDPALTRAAYPALYHLLDRVSETANFAAGTAKNHWNIKRPYATYPQQIKALVTPPGSNPTYPSGHTTTSYSMAYVLGMLIPEKRSIFLARAEEIARHRVLAGVHYPSDLAGGREMAMLVTGALTQDVAFQSDLLAAQKELAAK